MALWMVVIISNLSNSICKVAENKNAIVQRLLDVLHKPFQAAVNRGRAGKVLIEEKLHCATTDSEYGMSSNCASEPAKAKTADKSSAVTLG